jgi:hypothetical protein
MARKRNLQVCILDLANILSVSRKLAVTSYISKNQEFALPKTRFPVIHRYEWPITGCLEQNGIGQSVQTGHKRVFPYKQNRLVFVFDERNRS